MTSFSKWADGSLLTGLLFSHLQIKTRGWESSKDLHKDLDMDVFVPMSACHFPEIRFDFTVCSYLISK